MDWIHYRFDRAGVLSVDKLKSYFLSVVLLKGLPRTSCTRDLSKSLMERDENKLICRDQGKENLESLLRRRPVPTIQGTT